MGTNSVKTTKITIKKNEGLTQALKRLVESKPNSVLSDGKITLSEWNATIDKLVEINEQRSKEGKKSIFTGGTDRKDYRKNFIVHTAQEIEFTEDEINQLYNAMGVTFTNKHQEEQEKELPPQNVEKQDNLPGDSAIVKNKPLVPADSATVKRDSVPNKVVVTDSATVKKDSVPNKVVATDSATAKKDSIPNKVVVTDSATAKKDSVPNKVVATDSATAKKDSIPNKVVVTDSAAAKKDSVSGTKVKLPAQPAQQVEQAEQPKKSRFSLSWSEIGKQAWKSSKNFVKGMFCDENGFSLKRTATTVGVIAGLALAAPAAAALGASAGVVSGIALATKVVGAGLGAMFVYNGGKKAIEGTKEYYGSENREQAEAAMEKAMDGAVELVSIPVLGALMKTSGKLVNMISKARSARPQPVVENKPIAELPTPKKAPAEPAPVVKPQPVAENKPAESAAAPKATEPAPAPKQPEVAKTEQTKPQSKTERMSIPKNNFIESEVPIKSEIKPRKVFDGEMPKDLSKEELNTILKALETQDEYVIDGIGRIHYSTDKNYLWLRRYQNNRDLGTTFYELNGKMDYLTLKNYDKNGNCILKEIFNHNGDIIYYDAITKDGDWCSFSEFGKITYNYGKFDSM